MSVEIVKKAMRRFIADPTPEVLCIKGKWGTGKTYAWEKVIEEASADKLKPIALKKYAYVSLFGVKDSSDIIQSVFANTNEISTKSPPRGLDKVFEFVSKRRAAPLFLAEHTTIPYVAGLGGVARAWLSTFVRDTLVCFDDFERKNESVSVNEVMGTIAQLRDARKCKVVLILNEDSLSDDEKAQFLLYSEKVIDASFKFEPTSKEAADIAFPDDDELNNILREACEQLGITNIRVLQKTHRYARTLMGYMNGIDGEVAKGVIRSLAVIAWAINSPNGEGAPDVAYLLETRQKQFFSTPEKNLSDNEVRWGVILDRFGFTHCDEFDRVLIEDIKNGFFNEGKIRAQVEAYLADTKRARAQAAIEAAWRPFHASFADDADSVAQALFDGCAANIMWLSPLTIHASVATLKKIGYPEKGLALLDSFMKARDRDDAAFDDYNFWSDMTDPDVVKAFDERAKQIAKALPTPLEAASRIYKGSWSQAEEECLAKLSVDDFISLFKANRGDDRNVPVLASLQMGNFKNASERQKSIANNARAALEKIAKETPLNAQRVKASFNLSIEPEQATSLSVEEPPAD